MDDERKAAPDQPRILVLGIGNILWADEGFGVRVLETLDASHAFADTVTLLDGGTQGLYLLPYLEEADGVIIVDAVDYGLVPGTLHILADAEVPAVLAARKVSLHQTGFQEILGLLALRGKTPARIVLVGVQPQLLDDYGGGLTATIAAQVPAAARKVLDILAAEFGIVPAPRAGEGTLVTPAVARDAYETERPSAEAACRIGDPRVLAAARS
ncbi:HyaD/HybD family hydrogenase maturation endopeptidase [Xanthobacter dioxanivorans]|uniref:Hydrogenase expression/formation protein HupD n=1 Tax=Xanthobacter dioxanivorans TaxID=2528964 RepID=A0A974SKT0_9HYPH|nr:HyaD/HybD family hydrogenase maturation endopeptidase [Xanthobacter dioxanivorans]QRG07838.1 HyaD/HybD family hydrogenase maturation endopeptidase [Xanthobacter dioxanivorans]